MKRDIHLLGLNHRTASVEIRERFALTERCSPETWLLPQSGAIAESLILSTCNRVELTLVGGPDAPEEAIERWCQARGRRPDELRPYIYCHHGEDAIRHMFSVASSLDSLVLGEPQILGQLKAAYRAAVAAKTTGTILSKLMHKSFSVAKRVRTETAVASSAVSVSYAAVELAKRIFDDMGTHEAMLIGAGEMAELAAMHLLQAGIRRIRVANRTAARAEELAERIGADVVPFERFFEHLAETDIVISSTGSPDPILCAKDMREAMRRRKQRPMFLIDIAMPRDIDPEVNTLDNVYLYDIDDLKEVVEENQAQRRGEAQKARAIVVEETGAFLDWTRSLELQPTIVDLVRRGEDIMQEELALTCRRLAAQGTLTEDARDALRVMADSLIRRFNHEPIMFLRSGLEDGETNHHLTHIAMVREIFQLDASGASKFPDED